MSDTTPDLATTTERDRLIEVIEEQMPAETAYSKEFGGNMPLAPDVGDLADALLAAGYQRVEAGETRTEWGVRSGEYVDAHPTGQSARTEVRRYGGDLMRRQVGPWVPVEDETAAELAGRDGDTTHA
jgi:hypothetical protein